VNNQRSSQRGRELLIVQELGVPHEALLAGPPMDYNLDVLVSVEKAWLR